MKRLGNTSMKCLGKIPFLTYRNQQTGLVFKVVIEWLTVTSEQSRINF